MVLDRSSARTNGTRRPVIRYAIITGSGRSGTNWLLDTFDASPATHCRNEPHGIPGTPLNIFPRVWNSDAAGSVDLYRRHWDKVAQGTARRFGESDHSFRYPKQYLYPWSNRGLSKTMTGPRARATASVLDRRLRGSEWELPRWLGSRRTLAESHGVLKIVLDAPLLSWLLDERAEVPVVHIVRHPGGRLQSWQKRLVGPSSAEQRSALAVDRAARLERIRAFDPRWRQLIPEPPSLPLTKLELWYWRYVNESTLTAARGHDSYRLVRFDDLAADPVGHAERLYRHVGLPWDEEMRRRVAADASRSVFGAVSDSQAVARAWRTQLPEEDLAAIDEVLSGSPLAELLG